MLVRIRERLSCTQTVMRPGTNTTECCGSDAFVSFRGKPLCLGHAVVRAGAVSEAEAKIELERIIVRGLIDEARKLVAGTKLIGKAHPFVQALELAERFVPGNHESGPVRLVPTVLTPEPTNG